MVLSQMTFEHPVSDTSETMEVRRNMEFKGKQKGSNFTTYIEAFCVQFHSEMAY